MRNAQRRLKLTDASCSVCDAGGVPVVGFAGELDIVNAGWFEERVQALLRPGKSIVVHLREVTYLDSSILHAMLRIASTCRKGGSRLFLAEPTKAVARVLGVTGLDRMLGVEEHLESALNKARSACFA